MKGARETNGRLRRERPVELGDEPALSVDRRLGPAGQRGVNARWLAGTVLTGFASTALMGGALYASLDRETNFATIAESVAADYGTADGPVTVALKSDRLVRAQVASHVQLVKLDTTMRVGNREFVKVQNFARVTTGLALSRESISPDPPPFDPLKIFASTASDEETLAANRSIEGDVSLVLTKLDESALNLEGAGEIPPEEIARTVHDAAEFGQARANAEMRIQQASLFDFTSFAGRALAYAPRDLDSFADLAVRGREENVSTIAKSEVETAENKKVSTLGPDDKIVEYKSGDKLEAILTEHGSSAEEAAAIVEVLQERFPSEKLKPGLKIRMGISPGEDDRTRLRPVRVSIFEEDEHLATVALSDTGQGYVAVDDPADIIAEAPEPEEQEVHTHGPTLSLYASLFETARKNNIPRSVFDLLIKAYSYDTDLHRKVKPGDYLEVFYAKGKDGSGEVFYSSLNLGGDEKKYYRYQSPRDGSIGFFDEKGKSARKFLMKKPITGGRRSSGFGMRRHPILGYAKMHTGIDYAAPRGTPILAAGDGVVERAGWFSSYGRYVKVQHSNGYETAYAHMHRIAKGLKPGQRVRQGQVIGYVGTTGRSSGNHLHYEVLVRGRFVNPASLKVPRGEELEGLELAAFEHERKRIDWAMKRAPGETVVAETQ